ncbi:MAG: rhodanese [Saprospiraceae bacterium]|nr:MAG: rhodanese [Saprospiraceae bacterium]
MEDKSCKTPRWRMLKSKLNNLSPEAFQQAIAGSEQPIVIDVRTEKEFVLGHISGAINISFFAYDFWDQIEALPAGATYFVYCRTGRRSIRTCTLMRNGGFDEKRIFNMEGGWAVWQTELVEK